MTGIAFVQPGQHIQRMQTVYRRFTDQHGRVFAAQSDIRNSQPKEELRPVNDDPRHTFSPPWLPPMRFAIFTDGSMDFRWDYDTMATELSGDAANYYQDAMEFALEHNLPMPEMGGTVDRKIILLKGKPPLSPAIPLACEQGDPWMLGKPGAVVNETLQQVLTQGVQSNSKAALDIIKKALAEMAEKNAIPLVAAKANPADKPAEKTKTINDVVPGELPNYKEFVKECRGRGMKMPDIYAMWDEHKRLAEG